jgi:hypothetical protein
LGAVDFGGGADFSSSVAVTELDLELPFLGVADKFFDLRQFTVTNKHTQSLSLSVYFLFVKRENFKGYNSFDRGIERVILFLFRRWLLNIRIDSSRWRNDR